VNICVPYYKTFECKILKTHKYLIKENCFSKSCWYIFKHLLWFSIQSGPFRLCDVIYVFKINRFHLPYKEKWVKAVWEKSHFFLRSIQNINMHCVGKCRIFECDFVMQKNHLALKV
jgi:hypothetical protein